MRCFSAIQSENSELLHFLSKSQLNLVPEISVFISFIHSFIKRLLIAERAETKITNICEAENLKNHWRYVFQSTKTFIVQS